MTKIRPDAATKKGLGTQNQRETLGAIIRHVYAGNGSF